jgi:hypothetical protein
MQTLSAAYLESVGKKGSWSYQPNMTEASIEATCWCAIACRKNIDVAGQTVDYFISTQNADGGWSDDPGNTSDWATGPALLALSILSRQHQPTWDEPRKTNIAAAMQKGFQRLVGLRTDLMGDLARVWLTVVQGPDFDYPRGWPWAPQTYNWVEPTAYALMAIKSADLLGKKRYKDVVDQAHAYLLQKSCKPAGWNFGAPEALGTYAPAMPLPTALAVMALQDDNDSKVDAATAYLKALNGPVADTTIADAFCLLARDARGEDMSSSVAQFPSRYRKRNHDGENLIAIAAAVIALGIGKDGNPLKLRGNPNG